MQLKPAPWNWYKTFSKIVLLTVWRRYFCVIYVLSLSCFRVCSLLPCGHLLRKGLPLGSCLWCLIVFLSLSHVVSWVGCRTWLYRFLVFSTFLTFIVAASDIGSPKVTYTYFTFNFCFLCMKYSITAWWGLMEVWKELLFFLYKNRLQSIYTSIVSCSLKTHTFLLVICGVSFFIPAMCIVYICSVLTSSIIISLENVCYIVS